MIPKEKQKFVGDRLDIELDWTDALADIADDEIITVSTWVLGSGDLVIELPGSFDTHKTLIWCSGGTAATHSLLKNTVTTNGGRILTEYVDVGILEPVVETAAGRYTTLLAVERLYGRQNVLKWAEIESDDVIGVAARVASLITAAEDFIDDMLRGGAYPVPFTGTVPPLIVNIATALAGVMLYEARGVPDFNPETGAPQHRLHYHRKRAEVTLARIKAGVVRLNVESANSFPFCGSVDNVGYPDGRNLYYRNQYMEKFWTPSLW